MWEAKRNLGYTRYSLHHAERIYDGAVIGETGWILLVNRRRWVTFMCTPQNIHHLALGFMLAEGVIRALEDILQLKVYEAPNRVYWLAPALGLQKTLTMRGCEEAVGIIDARVAGNPVPDYSTRVLTSGCSGGVTFDDLSSEHPPLDMPAMPSVSPRQVLDLTQELNRRAVLYRECRGVHTSALSDGKRFLVVAEDVGRHNTLDKIRGCCLLGNIDTEGGILLTTGRISSEMLTKARGMRVPVVISRTSPTALAVELAEAWGMTVIGYARGNRMNVYTGDERIRIDTQPPSEGRLRVDDSPLSHSGFSRSMENTT
ncbi:MAG: formate dehydrogenase accessory sulfurtransferase FdhD [Anaerolineae bacterium]